MNYAIAFFVGLGVSLLLSNLSKFVFWNTTNRNRLIGSLLSVPVGYFGLYPVLHFSNSNVNITLSVIGSVLLVRIVAVILADMYFYYSKKPVVSHGSIITITSLLFFFFV